MFLSLGTGSELGVTSGMFHLFTHAFFKALLFLGAGSVMHAMGGVIDVREFGGLKRLMPWTRWTFLIGCLALAGLVPFAGFWSKDEILAAVSDKAAEQGGSGLYSLLYYSGVFTAFLTAFYTFRAYFLTFHGEERIPKEAGHHAHESPPAMTGPLAILAVGAALVGIYFFFSGDFLSPHGFLMQSPTLSPLVHEGAEKPENFHWTVAITSTVIALAGIGLAWLFYMAQPSLATTTMNFFKSTGLYALSYHKFFIDEIYVALIVRPLEGLAWLCSVIDNYLIDGTVNLFGYLPRWVGYVFRPLQGGLVPFYALVMALGVLALAGALIAQ
jgi:NADH-quinone oxidoreductase subunit L